MKAVKLQRDATKLFYKLHYDQFIHLEADSFASNISKNRSKASFSETVAKSMWDRQEQSRSDCKKFDIACLQENSFSVEAGCTRIGKRSCHPTRSS